MSYESDLLTGEVIQIIAKRTVDKINSYPKRYGRTVDNYFDLLFPDEVNAYFAGKRISELGRANGERRVAECVQCAGA